MYQQGHYRFRIVASKDDGTITVTYTKHFYFYNHEALIERKQEYKDDLTKDGYTKIDIAVLELKPGEKIDYMDM